MTEKELFRETFSHLHASDTVYEEVLEMAEKSRKRKGRYIPRKMAVACAVAVIVSGITVSAAVGSGFFQSIFGSKGQENVGVHEIEGAGKNQGWLAPGREWENADEAAAEKLTGEHAAQIGASTTVYGYTLTMDTYIIDENGIGAITYTLSNPDGLNGIRFNEYGEYYMTPDSPMKEIYMKSTGGKPVSVTSIVDYTQTTDTELHAILYFAPFEKLDVGEGLQIIHSGYEANEMGEILTEEKQEITFTPDSFVPTATCASDTGYTAHISPIGILIDGPVFEKAQQSWALKKLLVTYTDGTVYQARDTDVENILLGCYSSSGDLYLIFNRLVDTEKIASVTVNGPDGKDMVFTM